MLGAEGAWQNPMRSPATTGHPLPFDLYVMVPDVDAFFVRGKEDGAEVTSEPDDMFWGHRMASFKDIDGYRWSFASPIKDFDPQMLHEARKRAVLQPPNSSSCTVVERQAGFPIIKIIGLKCAASEKTA